VSAVQGAGDRFTEDAIFNGKILVRQRADGYRFSIDALLLAWYAWALPGLRMLELGTGSGVVSLALASKRPDLRIDAVEIQEGLAELARRNAADNGLSNIQISEADLRELRGPEWEGRFDIVVSNPPYRTVGRGRLNPEPEKAGARHEILCTLEEVVSTAAAALAPGGSTALVILAERVDDLLRAALSAGQAVRHLLWVRPFRDKPANMLLAVLQRQPSSAAESELVVYKSRSCYTPAIESILSGEWERVPHPLSL
jgi:tRNA1Val (adenine37-N6)-methyltransferase